MRDDVVGLFYNVQGGLRRNGLRPALAPRMPVITEEVS